MPKISEGPMHPDADPTAPGGMTRADIRVDLAENHGINMNITREVTLPGLVNMLIQARLTRDAKMRKDRPALLDDTHGRPTPEEFQPAPEEDEEEEDMLAEFDDDPEPEPEPQRPISEVADEAQAIVDQVVTTEPLGLPVRIARSTAAATETDDILSLLDEDDDSIVINTQSAYDSMTQADHDEVADLFEEIAEAQPAPLFIGMPGTLDYRFDNHAGAGPSAAERWMNCTASLGAVRAFLETLSPNQQHQFASANTAARQGTTAHSAAESEINLLLGRISAEEHEATLMELTLEPPVAGEAYDDEMAEHLTEYTDFVQSFIATGHEIVVEARVEALIPLTVEGAYTHVYDDGDALPDWYSINGSADLVVLPTAKENNLLVGDLKYGDGIDVDVEANPQIRIYALGVLALLQDEEGNLPDLDSIMYAIIQPRLGGIKTWSESVDDLLTWRDEVLAPALTAALGLDGKAAFAPSDLACQWCPVKGGCPALTQQRLDEGADLFTTLMEAEYEGREIEAPTLDNDRLASLLDQIAPLVKLHESLKEEAQRRVHRGETLPGYQMVEYSPPRTWAEEAETRLASVKQVWKPRTLHTPKQALVLLGKEQAHLVDGLVVTPPKRPVIARTTDRRKPWTGIPPEQMFPDETVE